METTEEKPTLRDTIEASIDQVMEPETPIVSPENQAPADTRARDESGKFTKAEPVPAPVAEPVAAAPAIAAPTEPDPIAKPASWANSMEAKWAALDPETKAYIQKRETQFASGVSTYKGIADGAKPVMDAIAPFQADIERTGMPAAQAVHSLLSAHRTLSTGAPQAKLQFFNKLAQDYGIPIQAFYDPAVQQQFINSQPAQPQQQERPLTREQIREEYEAIRADEIANEKVSEMAANKEKYPAFQYVRGTMSEYIKTGQAKDPDEAYSLAIDAPEHASLARLFALQRTQQDEQQRAAAAATTAKTARANAVSPKSATPAAAVPSGKKGLRDVLNEQYDAKMGGARV